MILLLTLIISLKGQHAHTAANCREVMSAYGDSSIAFTISVELASTILLIRKNFGLGAYEFGALTVQLVWIITILVMLPVLYFSWNDLPDEKLESRLCAITIALILFLINFICRMVGTYSDGQVGTSVISQTEWDQIQALCWGQNRNLSQAGSVIIEIFSISASLWVILSIVAALIFPIRANTRNHVLAYINRMVAAMRENQITQATIILLTLIVFSVPLFWALIALRSWQSWFAGSLNESSGSNIWSFGQIIAVVVFLPVFSVILQQYVDKNVTSSTPKTRVIDTQVTLQTSKVSHV